MPNHKDQMMKFFPIHLGEDWEADLGLEGDYLDAAQLDAALRGLSSYDYVIFTSTNAVDRVRERLSGLGLDARSGLLGSHRRAATPKKSGVTG